MTIAAIARRRYLLWPGLFIVASLLMADSCGNSTPSAQQQGAQLTETYQEAANTAVPYPLRQMTNGGWLERSLLKENLLRQNDKNRLAYVVLMNQLGQPIAQYPIQGMVFELNSQMTVTNTNQCANAGSTGIACGVVNAAGDNGTYGPEPTGIGFFTTSGVEIKWNGLYVESDAPLSLTTKPVIVYDASSKPSVTAGGVQAKP